MFDPKKKIVAADNPIEIVKDVGRTVGEVPKQILDTAMEQIGLKPQRKPMMGEISLLNNIHKTNQAIEQKGASVDSKMRQLQYVQQKEREIYSAKQKAIETQVAKLMQELSAEVIKLEKQTAELTNEVRAVTVDVAPIKPGIYHLNFFEWVIGQIKDLRKKVNQSRLWLNVWSAKKQQKGYWAMYKKHGKKFAESDERAVAAGG